VKHRALWGAAAAALLAGGGIGLWSGGSDAADHIEAPAVQSDPAADITDFYAWSHDNVTTVILDFGSPLAGGLGPTYDADMLYGIHFDTDSDPENGAETSIWVRFGQDGAGNWGAQFTGIPGTLAPVVVAAGETVIEATYSVYTGQNDDPFFFDLAGFQSTVDPENADGSVDFAGFSGAPVDFFAGLNVTSIAVEFPTLALTALPNFEAWATTRRFEEVVVG
jgi:hypothetical protein